MKRIFLIGFLLLNFASFAQDDLKDVGISKYAVLETTQNNTAIRFSPDENAKRVTNLYKDTVLFADKQNKNYYRVEFEKIPNKPDYYWVNKKYAEIQGIIPEKRFEEIEKITFLDKKDRYQIEILSKTKSAFVLKKAPNTLDFTLYDNHFDPTNTKIAHFSDNFKISNKIENKLEISYKTNEPFFGYGVNETEGGYVYTIKKAPKINYKKPLKNIKVVVDPGHGGKEKGACANGLEEKTLNLQISKKLQKELKKAGAKAYLTRKKDVTLPLYDRIDFAKEKDADILISVHQNSLPNIKQVDKKHGVGTYYYNDDSKNLAKHIEQSLIIMTGFRNDGVNYASFALTRPTDFISVLVECGYIIKKDEALKLADKKFQKRVAKGIVKGIKDYLREEFLQKL